MSDDPKWLTDAIEAAAVGIHGGNNVTPTNLESHYHTAGGKAVRAALPAIREGLTQEIRDAQVKAASCIGSADAPVGLAEVIDGMTLAARIVRGTA